MGHGTYVSGIVNGRKSTDGINEVAGYADGTAPGSQLAFFDMEELNYGIADPGVERMLKWTVIVLSRLGDPLRIRFALYRRQHDWLTYLDGLHGWMDRQPHEQR